MKRQTVSYLLASLLICCLLPQLHAQNTSPMLTRPIMELYPKGPITGGLSRYGNMVVQTLEENNEKFIGFEQPAGNAHWMIRWFANHKIFSLDSLPVSDDLHLAIELRSDKTTDVQMKLNWKADDRLMNKQVSMSGSIKLEAGQWQTVTLPIPAVDKTTKLRGLFVQMSKPGKYAIRSVHFVAPSQIEAMPVSRDIFYRQNSIKLTGQTAAGIPVVHLRIVMDEQDGKHVVVEKNIATNDNQFTYTLNADQLQPGKLYHVQWRIKAGDPNVIDQPVFAYHQFTGKQLPAASINNGKLIADGKQLGFVGLNYTKFQLGYSNRTDFEKLTRHLVQLQDWGVNCVRLTLNMMMIQPKQGVYPEDAEYAQIIKAHNLDPRFIELLDYHVKLAGELGIYTIFDWHEYGTRPYRYFVGGQPDDKKKGKPGTALAWLAPDNRTGVSFDYSNALHRTALLDCHTWLAKHYQANPNILGIEVPFNEPHDQFAAVETNLRKMIDECAMTVKLQDPNRLCFGMTSSYSHDNATPTSTWMVPDRVDGLGSHFYMANGPIALRDDHKGRRHPWLCRDVDQTFYFGTASVLMPYATQLYPQYNGEDGDHGYMDFLPDMEPQNASRMMIENGMVTNWLAGQVGYLLWTMHETRDFKQFSKPVYEGLFQKYAPLFKAGPMDRSNSQVLFIQNPAAAQIANGHNYSCVPIAKLAIDLHLDPVHYMTDDQYITVGVARYAKGLEQVMEGSRDLSYKAIILDTRNCDQRVVKAVQKMKTPTLITDDISKITNEELAKFLSDAGVAVDTQTPTSIHLGVGPEHVVLYNHSGEKVTANAYPRVNRDSQFKLVTSDGKPLFTGTSGQLQSDGVAVSIEPRTALILQIQ
ncbi:MAG: cellulase family glycosylhydrolase [Phycisphaeraceae bacterium JB051]